VAEIRVERQTSRPVWPWLLGLLLLVGVIWAVAEWAEEPDTVALTDPVQEQPFAPTDAVLTGAVGEYHDFSLRTAEQAEAATVTGDEYTSEGLLRLAAALDEVIRRDTIGQEVLHRQLDVVRQQAERVTTDPRSPEHARQVRDAFNSAATLIERAREHRMPQNPELQRRAGGAREAAQAIDPDHLLLQQRDTVHRFFRDSAEAIRVLATGAQAPAF
jgi:hypothetical protein